MTAFLEDPRLRQRWNQISHNAETATENAAASIWTFQHTYITPCLGSVGDALDACTAVCLGDRDERARRRRERERGRHRTLAEYSFDFYDDWYDDFEEGEGGSSEEEHQSTSGGTMRSLFSRGFFGSWRGSRAEDWDRLLAGSGSVRSGGGGGGAHHYDGDDEGGGGQSDGDGHGHEAGEVVDQPPRRKRGMSYNKNNKNNNTHPGAGARGHHHHHHRRKQPEGEDPTIIPSTAPLGFLGRLPFKIGGTLRYKPSAANLREHPFGDADHRHDENEPLLSGGGGGGGNTDEDYEYHGRRSGRYGTAAMTMAPVSSSSARPSGRMDGADADAGYYYGPAAAEATRTINTATRYTTGATTTTIRTPPPSPPPPRNRSSTVGSGDTSDSYRSRGDLFPSDEEDDEDAVPLDDEFAVALGRVDDRSSGRTRFSSSSSLVGGGIILQGDRRRSSSGKGKDKDRRRVDMGASCASLVSMASQGSGGTTGPRAIGRRGGLSRSVSRTTMDDSVAALSSSSRSVGIEEHFGDDEHDEHDDHDESMLSVDELQREDERVAREEDAAVERRRQAAVRLARERGLDVSGRGEEEEAVEEDVPAAASASAGLAASPPLASPPPANQPAEFIPARLPRFS